MFLLKLLSPLLPLTINNRKSPSAVFYRGQANVFFVTAENSATIEDSEDRDIWVVDIVNTFK